MSLFKNNIVMQPNILGIKNGILFLHCSANDYVRAPFNGKLNKDGVLIGQGKSLKIFNMKINLDAIGKVKAGDNIGLPMVSNYNGRTMAYIGLEVRNKNEQENALKYFRKEDKSEELKTKKKTEVTENEVKTIIEDCINQEVIYEEDNKINVKFSVDKDEVMNKVLETIEEEK